MKEQIDLSREYGMVLEGGGARGAYQIGAWKALREAGVRIKGIAGTSVGALNGALICMDHVEFAEAIWKTMAYSRVMDVDDAMMESLRKMDMKALDLYGLLNDARRVFTEKGVDITPLKKLIAGCVDEEKIRNSPCEFYVTTYSVTDRKEIDVNMKEVPPGTMKDILLASAFFPGFKSEKLGGKVYMDGGRVNNVPVDVLAKRGYRDILAVRIFGIGVEKPLPPEIAGSVSVLQIRPSGNLGGILEFTGKRARRNLLMGYFDIKRFLYGLAGRNYYIDMPYTEAYYFDKMMSEMELFRLYAESVMDREETEKLSGYRVYTEKIFPAMAKRLKLPSGWDYRDMYAALLESCAKRMRLDPFRIYTDQELSGEIQRVLGDGNLQAMLDPQKEKMENS